MDLVNAHLLALNRLRNGRKSTVYNLGNGKGFSVKQVIEAARNVTGHKIPQTVAPRRAGDPAVLVASSEKIIKELDWKPKYDDLNTIIASAWEWHKNIPMDLRNNAQRPGASGSVFLRPASFLIL